MKHRNFKILALTATLSTLLGIGAAYAATQTVTSDIRYFSDISITQNSRPQFGYAKAAQAGVYTLDTAGVVTPSGGGVLEGGSTAAGSYTITGSGSQAINITDSAYTASGDSTPSAAKCKYGAGSEVSCTNLNVAAPTSGGTPLLVGLTITAAGASTDGQHDTPSFTLTVLYQ